MLYYKKYYSSFILLFFITFLSAQESKTPLVADAFIGIDNLENTFYIKDNTLYKTGTNGSYNYTNINLGEIEKVDISNSLKVLVYYKDFNTIVWLDSNLNEINIPLDLNTIFSNPLEYVSNAFNNSIWTYNDVSNTVNLLNITTLEIDKSVLIDQNLEINFIASSYKAIYLFTNEMVIEVNYIGTISEIDLKTKLDFAICTKKKILYFEEDSLSFFDFKNKTKKLWKELPKKAKTYFVLGESIYIFEKNYLYKYSLPKLN